MDESYFKQCLDLLQKSGEATRSTIYTFVLIYGALLLWALNIVVYPAEQQRFGQVKNEVEHITDCLYFRDTLHDRDNCDRIIKERSVYFQAPTTPEIGRQQPAGDAKQIADILGGINLDYLKSEINYHKNKSSEVAEFHVPLVGIISDRSWIWLVNIAAGLFFYYIIRDSFRNLLGMLTYLHSEVNGDPHQLRLLTMTQIITTSGTRHSNATSRSYARTMAHYISFYAKFALFFLILTLPLCVSGLILYDWYYFGFRTVSDGSPGNTFREEPEYIGGILTIPVLIWEIIIFFSIIVALHQLFKRSEAIRSSM